MKTLDELEKEFGARVCTLNSGAAGIRAGLHFTVKEVTDGNAQASQMDFIGSDASVDRYNEVIDPKAWGDMKNFRANPVIPDCHDYSSVAKILGRAVSVEVRDGKLCNRVEFCLDNPMGLLAYKMAKGGFINSQSVGFIPEDWTSGKNASEPDRTYIKCELLEISMVVVPANPGATIGNQIKSVLNASELRDFSEFLKSISTDQANPEDTAGASVQGIYDAHLLRIAKGLRDCLK